MACSNFKCENETVNHECSHKNHFTVDCLDMRCEGHSCCCMCVTECDKNKRNKVKSVI